MPPRAKPKAKVVSVPVDVPKPPPPPPKPKQESLRWERIQATRRKNPRTGEPQVGSLGVAFLYSASTRRVEKVAVLTKDGDGRIRVQRAIGGQIISVPLSELRTYDEFWDGLKAVEPTALPANKIDPQTNMRWDFTKLAANILGRAFKETE
jgi:hypothetical protein